LLEILVRKACAALGGGIELFYALPERGRRDRTETEDPFGGANSPRQPVTRLEDPDGPTVRSEASPLLRSKVGPLKLIL